MAMPLPTDDLGVTKARAWARWRSLSFLVGAVGAVAFFASFICLQTFQGFLYGRWLPISVVTSLVICVCSFTVASRCARRAGQLLGVHPAEVDNTPTGSALRVQPPATYIIAIVLGYIYVFAAALMLVPPTVAAHLIGRPSRSIALAAAGANNCGRCQTTAEAVFATSTGQLVRARLAAVGQDASSYRPGLTIVYDARHPTHAMALSDYQQGRSGLIDRALYLPTGALVIGQLVGVPYVRRRRQFFAAGRPDARITAVSYRKRRRGPGRWRLVFGDQRRAWYLDLPGSRLALRQRLEQERGLTIGPTESELLDMDQPV